MPAVTAVMRASRPARRSGVSKRPVAVSRIHSISASGRAPASTSETAPLPPERTRSSGSWPSGRLANKRLLPGLRRGSARSTARNAARWPASSPSKQRIGSSPIFHKRGSGSAGSAVPSGATARGKTGGHHRDHVDIAFDRDQLGALVGRLARDLAIVERGALVEERRLGRVEIFGRNVLLQRAAAERDDATGEIADRKHDAVAEAV